MSLWALVVFGIGLGLGVALTVYLLRLEEDDEESSGEPPELEADDAASTSVESSEESEPEGAEEDELESWMKEQFGEADEGEQQGLGDGASTDVYDEGAEERGSLKERSSLNRGTIEQTVEKGAFAKEAEETFEEEGPETARAQPEHDDAAAGPRGAPAEENRSRRETRDVDAVSTGSGLSEESLADRLQRSRSGGEGDGDEASAGEVDHWLEGVGGSVEGEAYCIRGGRVELGRGTESDIRVAEGGVSRAHCRFRTEGGDLVVEDLESTNGTLLDGQPLAAGESYQLEHGDLVEAAAVSLLYHRGAEFEEDALDDTGEISVLSASAATVEVDTRRLRDRIDEELDRVGGDVDKAADILDMEPEVVRKLASQASEG